MSANQPSVAGEPGSTESISTPSRRRVRLRWLVWAAALAVGVAVGGTAAVLHRSHPAATGATAPPLGAALATWGAGVRPAPDFELTDQHGRLFSLRGLRGRPVIVTFIDPLCRNLCPLEAKVLGEAERQLAPARRPAIVAVSVNPWGDTTAAFRDDASRWQLGPQWRWGAGTQARLAAVWKRYEVGVDITTKTIAGVTVHEIAHTEAAYVVDATGHERALFVYPYTAADVVATLQQLTHS